MKCASINNTCGACYDNTCGRYCNVDLISYAHIQAERETKEAELDALLKKTPRDLWNDDLDAFLEVCLAYSWSSYNKFILSVRLMRCGFGEICILVNIESAGQAFMVANQRTAVFIRFELLPFYHQYKI